MQNTFYRNMGRPDQEKSLPQPPLALPPEQGERITLPTPGVLSLGATPLNEGLNALFGLDGVTRFVIYLATVGKRPE